MSMGIGTFANKLREDADVVIYEYGSYNLNEVGFENKSRICDGSIAINKTCFIEPEIHKKLKKMPCGRKKIITKRIPVSVDYMTMIRDGLIIIENCGNCWRTTDDENYIDVMASRLLFYIFNKYQKYGEIPEHINCNV